MGVNADKKLINVKQMNQLKRLLTILKSTDLMGLPVVLASRFGLSSSREESLGLT